MNYLFLSKRCLTQKNYYYYVKVTHFLKPLFWKLKNNSYLAQPLIKCAIVRIMTAKFSKTRETIIEVARNVFGEMGYYNTTINDIALACNRGRRTIYTYFKSKDEIYNEVIKVESSKMATNLRTSFSQVLDPYEKLRLYMVKRMQIVRELVYTHTALQSCFFKDKAHFDQIRREFDKEEVKVILEVLDDGIRRNVFQVQNMSLTAHNLLVTLKAFESNFLDMNPSEESQEKQRNILRVILFGIFNNNNLR